MEIILNGEVIPLSGWRLVHVALVILFLRKLVNVYVLFLHHILNSHLRHEVITQLVITLLLHIKGPLERRWIFKCHILWRIDDFNGLLDFPGSKLSKRFGVGVKHFKLLLLERVDEHMRLLLGFDRFLRFLLILLLDHWLHSWRHQTKLEVIDFFAIV